MTLHFHPYDQSFVDAVRAGGPDANGQPAERHVSDGAGTPCRSCLHDVPAGAAMLILAARPFPAPQPYAELGPIFLCADALHALVGRRPAAGTDHVARLPVEGLWRRRPDHLRQRADRGVGRDRELCRRSSIRPGVAYVDVRSARNNCFQTRITRDHVPEPA